MVAEEITFRLKDGRQAELRSPEERDVPGLLEYLPASCGETDFLMRYPEEWESNTYETEKAVLDRANASQDEAMLVCLVDGRIAGVCQIVFNSRIKTRHRASVAVSILKEFWNQGIGTRMFQEMIRLARERGGVLQIELEFVEGNSRARHLYEKMGFRITGVRPDAVRLKDGTFLNEYIMVRAMEPAV